MGEGKGAYGGVEQVRVPVRMRGGGACKPAHCSIAGIVLF